MAQIELSLNIALEIAMKISIIQPREGWRYDLAVLDCFMYDR